MGVIMLALALLVAISSADLQRWMDDQPAVRAYQQQRVMDRTPRDDDFRHAPGLPREAACRGSRAAAAAAVVMFKTADGGKLLLTQPDLQIKNAGQAMLQLDDPDKQALEDRGRRYEQDAGLFEPSCLG